MSKNFLGVRKCMSHKGISLDFLHVEEVVCADVFERCKLLLQQYALRHFFGFSFDLI